MFIYVIGPETGPQKIGITTDTNQRLRTLQTGYPETLYIHHFEEIDDKKTKRLETKIHRELNHKKLKGEWFNLTSQEAIEFVTYFRIRYEDDINI